MATDQPSAPATPPNSVPSPQKPRRKGRVLLILLLGLAAALVIGGGAAFVVYDQATAIDRSNPEVVTRQFLTASLVEQDPAKVSLFVCRQWSADDAMRAVDPPTDQNTSVAWGVKPAKRNGSKATVDVTLEFKFGTGIFAGGQVADWQLGLEDQDGWRVCSVSKS